MKIKYIFISFFENFIQCALIKSVPYSLPSNSFQNHFQITPFHLHDLLIDLSLISATYMCVHGEPCTGAWTTFQDHIPEERRLFFPQGPSSTNNSSARRESCVSFFSALSMLEFCPGSIFSRSCSCSYGHFVSLSTISAMIMFRIPCSLEVLHNFWLYSQIRLCTSQPFILCLGQLWAYVLTMIHCRKILQ